MASGGPIHDCTALDNLCKHLILGIAACHSLGLVSNRMGLPLCIRSCFYPMLGNVVFGTLGDLIDALAMLTTLVAVCASMGIGAIQINTGFHAMNSSIEQSQWVQMFLITCVTIMAGVSGDGVGALHACSRHCMSHTGLALMSWPRV